MRVITVPDLHGKDIWKTISPDDWDKIIFLGDYVDGAYRSHKHVSKVDSLYGVIVDPNNGVTNSEMVYNLSEIIEFKKKYPDKVELLLGNHDVPYLYLIKNKSLQHNMMCSGYRSAIEYDIAKLLYSNKSLFKISYRYKNYMWSHAGLTPIAYNIYFKKLINNNFDILCDELNKYFILDYEDIFAIGQVRDGSCPYGSILWADKSEWDESEYIFPFIQIVGHSQYSKITYKYSEITSQPIVIFVDVLNTISEFLELDIK